MRKSWRYPNHRDGEPARRIVAWEMRAPARPNVGDSSSGSLPAPGVVIELAAELKIDLLDIGATGISALYERMIGSRPTGRSSSHRAACWW